MPNPRKTKIYKTTNPDGTIHKTTIIEYFPPDIKTKKSKSLTKNDTTNEPVTYLQTKKTKNNVAIIKKFNIFCRNYGVKNTVVTKIHNYKFINSKTDILYRTHRILEISFRKKKGSKTIPEYLIISLVNFVDKYNDKTNQQIRNSMDRFYTESLNQKYYGHIRYMKCSHQYKWKDKDVINDVINHMKKIMRKINKYDDEFEYTLIHKNKEKMKPLKQKSSKY